MKTIHPLFKNFIMHDAVREWDRILKEDGCPQGVRGGVCFSTSNAFCKILDRDFEIPCTLEMVETIAGNKHAIDLFDYYMRDGDAEAFFIHLEELNREKGKENLTSENPVIVGMGAGGQPDQFHFVMNLYQHGEAVDLTLDTIKRPQWGIDCNNYWAKYDRSLYGAGAMISESIRKASNCVVMTTKKKSLGRVGLEPERYQRQENRLRDYIHSEVRRRRIPVFFR